MTTTYIILLAQKKDEANMAIMILFAVATILGFLILRLYFKSIYKWRIKGFQYEKENLKARIVSLNADKVTLYKSFQMKNIENEHLTKEIQKKVETLEHLKKQLFLINSEFIHRNN